MHSSHFIYSSASTLEIMSVVTVLVPLKFPLPSVVITMYVTPSQWAFCFQAYCCHSEEPGQGLCIMISFKGDTGGCANALYNGFSFMW